MMKANKGSSDACLALLGYRNTPTQGLDTSPVERFKSRRTKTLLPSIIRLLQPQIPDGQHEKMLSNQERQAKNYSRGARTLSDFKPGDTVRMYRGPSKTKDQELLKAAVNSKVGSRSNNVVTEDGRKFRRNRVHLRKSQEEYQPGRETTPLTNEQSWHSHQWLIVCQQWPAAIPKAIRRLPRHQRKVMPVTSIQETKIPLPDKADQWEGPDN